MTVFSPDWTPTPVTGKRGTRYQLRRAAVEDAAGLYALERAVLTARDGMVLRLEDLSPSLEAFHTELAERLQGRSAPERGIELVIEAPDGTLAGSAGAARMGPSMVRHTVLLAVQVHPAWQGRGLGRALMEGLISWAERPAQAPPRVRRLELYVRADNPRAVRLYESLGFEHEGTRRGLVCADDGHFVDDLIMARWLP